MADGNFSVARVTRHSQETVGKFERHNERKNESYGNMNVDLDRTPMNVSYKSCGELTYNEYLKKLMDEGKVSMRGLKKDAKVYDEMIFDVNTYYFEQHGGYEYARRFYEEAFHFAEKEYGADNIISAVMHADEINLWLSDTLNKPVYHYHLHIIALPVVEKQVLWTKRCKDKELVGTVKEVVHQISHSKKWKSEQLRDKAGKPIYDAKGKPQYIPSYSLLQDRFFEHMQEAGFNGFQRGERGSTAEHLDCVDFKLQESNKHLSEVQEKIAQAEKQFAEIEPVKLKIDSVDSIGRKSFTGKVQLSQEEYSWLAGLAKEGIVSRDKISQLQSFNKSLGNRCRQLEVELGELKEKCKPYLEALKRFPDKVKAFLSELLQPKDKPKEEKTQWDAPIRPRNTKKKEDYER